MRKKEANTINRMELRDKILETAMCEFFERGIRAVKMDDIAKLFTISKRTLYEMYPNKEALLVEGLRRHIEQRYEYMQKYIATHDTGVMDILIELYHVRLDSFSNISPIFFTDMQKYKKAVQYVRERRQLRQQFAHKYFKIGVEQGYFRKDIDYGIISVVGFSAMEIVVRDAEIAKKGMRYIFNNLVCLFIRGFCTQKGISLIDKKLKP